MIYLWFHTPSIWRVYGFGRDGATMGMIYLVGVSQMALGKSINCRDDKSYLRASSPLRFFYSFFMLHNPRVSPCTQYRRSVHLCDLSPQYTKSSYTKINTIILHSLIWGDQYQPLISKLPSLGLLNLENFNILLSLFHLNKWATSSHRMLLTHWSTKILFWP